MRIRTLAAARGSIAPCATLPQYNRSLASLIARRAIPAAGALTSLVVAANAQAAIINVTAGAVDNVNNNGNCSLVEAITSANTNTAVDDCTAGGGTDYLILPANSRFTFTAPNNSIDGANALPQITSPITIQGNGSIIERSTVSGTPDFRLINITNSGELALNNVTLQNGAATGAGYAAGSGGAILNRRGVLTLNNSTVRNSSANNDGGAIAHYFANLTINRSTISGNRAGGSGGGLLTNTNLSTQTTTLVNSTLSGNTAAGGGGAVYNYDGRTIIQFSTLTNNSAPNGAGIASRGNTYTQTQLQANILSGNSGFDLALRDGSTNSFVSQGNNLIGSVTTAASGAFNQTGDQTGALVALGPLRNNFGYTETPTCRMPPATRSMVSAAPVAARPATSAACRAPRTAT